MGSREGNHGLLHTPASAEAVPGGVIPSTRGNTELPMTVCDSATSARGRSIRRTDAGYAMAALLVAMSIMAVMLTAVMPVWKHAAQREKEEELVFRGRQYVHAIGLFQRKFANAMPPNVDVLVDQRFLRKKYKDPITNDDFVPLSVGAVGVPGTAAQGGGDAQRGTGASPSGAAAGASRGQTSTPTAPQTGGRGISPIGTPAAGGTTAGIIGVTSKSKD